MSNKPKGEPSHGRGASSLEHHKPHHHQSFWLWVLCLTGVDYFSTLGYQPSIAYENLGLLSPLATVVLVLVTLGGAYPIYAYVAGQSPHGQGSIAMLERLVHGWTGKFLVLILLGFAATDFVITKTLSAADAAEHLIENPFWHGLAPEWMKGQMTVTMILLVLLGAMFLRGFREVIFLAVGIVGVYLFLNLIIVLTGLAYLVRFPEHLGNWYGGVASGEWHMDMAHNPFSGHEWWVILAVCLIYFPKLALGLSGFETGVAVMPLVKGSPEDDPARPRQRIRNTRKLLLTAALIMSFYLLGSAVVTSMLIKPEAFLETAQPRALNRSLAYLAHNDGHLPALNPLFGDVFGTLYDLSTVAILWFAGASAMSALINLVPQYLPRYGMAPEWARAVRPLAVLFTGVNLFVTWMFNASVTAQGAAYATGVMVLMFSASVAVIIDQWRTRTGLWLTRLRWDYLLIAGVFLYTTIAIVIEKPSGIAIASCFIAAVLISSMVSRTLRATELRFIAFEFVDDQSRFLWESTRFAGFRVMVPHRPGRRPLTSKEEDIRRVHRLGPHEQIVFVEAKPGDASEFMQTPLMEVKQEEGRVIIRISRCASIAHVIATVALELGKDGKPPEIHFGWSDEIPLAASIRFVLFGEGNVPWMVRELIRKAEPDPERQSRVVIG